MRIATWNVRGIGEEYRRKQLTNDIDRYDYNVIGVQETHHRGTGSIELGEAKARSYTLHYTGPPDNGYYGAGIIVK